MEILIDKEHYEVIIKKKRIKNTYIRVKKDLKIYVTTNTLTNNTYIENLMKENSQEIKKMILREKKKLIKQEKFFYLGNEYNPIICNEFKNPVIDGNNIFIKNEESKNKFLVNEAKRIFPLRLKKCYDLMDANIPFPSLVIRKMTRKWGHCNKSKCVVTLNSELIKYKIDDIDYVIIHELCHLIHFNHSKAFWETVKKYKPNYKENKKSLKEE